MPSPILDQRHEKTENQNVCSDPPVCITGMHRSGTSLTAHLLNQCGLNLGRNEDLLGPKSDNPDGFWENIHFVKINDEILFRLGGAWDAPPVLASGWENRSELAALAAAGRTLAATFRGPHPWGWKDPRSSIVAKFWQNILGQDLRFILCLRNPLEVALSIQKRNGNSLSLGFQLWLAYNKILLADSKPAQRIITHYDSYFIDPHAELRRLLDFLRIDADAQAVAAACSSISRALRHHAYTREEIVKAGASRELVELYEHLCSLAGPVFQQPQKTASPAETAKSRLPEPLPPSTKKHTVSIVILTYNQMQFTRECVASIEEHTPDPHEIIFVDNGSTDGTVNWLRGLIAGHEHYRLIENRSNLGFARGCNQGMMAARGEYILLLNNDVVVTENWLSGLMECLASRHDSGIVGPMTDNISGTQRDLRAVFTTMRDMHEYAKAFRLRNRHRRVPLRRIVGFCMLFRRELVNRIGMLDESFGTGNFEDDDFCLRASLEGYRNMIAGDVFIHHYGSRTFAGNKISYGSTLSGNRKIFNEKWRIPAGSDLGRKLQAASAMEQADELHQAGEPEQSIERLLEGIRQVPDNPDIYRMMARICIDLKRHQDALDVLKSLPEANRDELVTLQLTGYAQEGLSRDPEAEACADAVLAREPGRAEAMNLKGILSYKRNDRASAETYFRTAVKSDPGYGEPFSNLGVIKWSGGDREGGLDLLERGFILSPCDAEVAVLYHTAAIEMAAIPRAERVFREAQALHPRNQRITFLLIDLLLKQERRADAMSAIEEAMTQFTVSDGLLSAALAVRDTVGPKEIAKGSAKKGTLSISMIVKNEERHLAKCLMSVRPIAGEMIVVDTGSSDRTREIARALGAKVFDFPWTGDFSAARNYSLEHCSGDWILSLDADEIIAASDYTELTALCRKGKPAAYKIVTRNYSNEMGAQGFTSNAGDYPAEEAGMGWFPSTKVRLFPNDRRIRFENPVHEFVEASVGRTNIALKECPVPVHHYGRLDVEKLRAKGEAYYQLGKKKLEEKGFADPKALFELGVQAGELKKFEEAAELFEKLVRIAPDYPLAVFNLGLAYLELHRYEDALPHAKKAYELDPERKETVLNYAHCRLILGDSEYAVQLLDGILRTIPDYAPATALLAVARAVQGDKSGSAGIVERLKASRFDCSPYLHEMAEGFAQSGLHTQALSVYELIVRTRQLRKDTAALIEKCYNEARQAHPAPDAPKTMNPYERQLSPEEIAGNEHRAFVGGMWDELGRLQFEFMKQQGLRPDHSCIDVGCGSMRGGLHYITYLDPGHYYGIDINASLIEAAQKELEAAGLLGREPHLLVNDRFEMGLFNQLFDFGVAVSVFTHLPMNSIIRCLSEMRAVLKPEGVFYATFFEAPSPAYTGTITHQPGEVVTNYDSDPFHYSFVEIEFMAEAAGLHATLIGDWNHPRNQKMLAFSQKNAARKESAALWSKQILSIS